MVNSKIMEVKSLLSSERTSSMGYVMKPHPIFKDNFEDVIKNLNFSFSLQYSCVNRFC